MQIIDSETIHQRRMLVQEVIDLTQVNGKAYLEALKRFNQGFPTNPKIKILNEIPIKHEQNFAV